MKILIAQTLVARSSADVDCSGEILNAETKGWEKKKCHVCKKFVPVAIREVTRCKCRKIFCLHHYSDHACEYRAKSQSTTPSLATVIAVQIQKI
jgi:hypothetical protein